MKLVNLYEYKTPANKPKKRPNKTLWFDDYTNWVADIKLRYPEAVAFFSQAMKDEEDNSDIVALDAEQEKCYGRWSRNEQRGVAYDTPRPIQSAVHPRNNLKKIEEGEVIKGKFEQKLRSKKGMYKNPDIEVPKGYERFEVEKLGKKGGKIIGVKKDGTKKVISTSSSYEVASTLASAYNAGGYTDKPIRKVPLTPSKD